MRYESAELAKISINCCLVASVVVANTLAELCERIGAEWSEIAPALKLDRRIGPHAYLAPGLGIAGGNLERDLATVQRMADIRRYYDAKFGTGTLVSRSRDTDSEVIQTLVGYRWTVGTTMLELFYFSAEKGDNLYRTISVDYKAL